MLYAVAVFLMIAVLEMIDLIVVRVYVAHCVGGSKGFSVV